MIPAVTESSTWEEVEQWWTIVDSVVEEHRKERLDHKSPEVREAGRVDDSGGNGGTGEEGDGEVDREQQADDEDGQQGEPDAGEHVEEHHRHHFVEHRAPRVPRFQGVQPGKGTAFELLEIHSLELRNIKLIIERFLTWASTRASISSASAMPLDVVGGARKVKGMKAASI